ncbi:DNA-processing protein DprA [Trinickia sp.]|uniref:DNA-processing protein DprA n=1 Tax=Trinickia sp. TaxID=2571163 RepID=UPI003F80CD2C
MGARLMTPANLAAWLALASVRALAPAALRALLAAFGDVQTLLSQPFGALARIAGADAARAVCAAARADVGDQLARTLAWCARPGNVLLALDDPAYPSALLNMHDPPPLLYVSGQLEWLHAPGLAIVGSRNATAQGIEDARRFARELAGAGLVIASGLALGIDAAAHRGALEAGGFTVAVVGTGADIVYPAKHHALAHDIAAHGAIVSEWPLGTPAKPAHFPQRNRLIAGMTKGVLVIEAAPRSGSLITARLANEMGRDVFALPGSIHAPLSRGCHQLIKDGAMLTETPEDVLDGLGLAPKPAGRAHQNVAKRRTEQPQSRGAAQPLPAQAEPGPNPTLPLFESPPAPPSRALSVGATRVLEALGHAPAALEMLAARTEMDSATLQGTLLELELRGHVAVLPGGRYLRHVPA